MRVQHWALKLDAAIEAARHKCFAWGEHDCGLFAATVVELLTGRDDISEHRGHYRDARGGMRIVARVGGMEAMASEALGAPIPAVEAQRGDVVLVNCGIGGRAAFGICVGVHVAAPGANGLVFLPMEHWVKAWRV